MKNQNQTTKHKRALELPTQFKTHTKIQKEQKPRPKWHNMK